MSDFLYTSKWNSATDRAIHTRWFVNPRYIMLVIYDKQTDRAVDSFSWEKDKFWETINDLKTYCEDRGDVINGE